MSENIERIRDINDLLRTQTPHLRFAPVIIVRYQDRVSQILEIVGGPPVLEAIQNGTTENTIGIIRATEGVMDQVEATKNRIFDLVATFDDFSEDNDPYGEHDFGSIEVNGENWFFKHTYYDKRLQNGSEDPSSVALTTRDLTIMHSREY